MTTNTNEYTHAGLCLDIYLNNTSEIYERYTLPAVAAVVAAMQANVNSVARLDDVTAWGNLKFWISWQAPVKSALQAATRLVCKHDHMTPTASDIEAVKRNYCAYIIECAQYEINNPVNA